MAILLLTLVLCLSFQSLRGQSSIPRHHEKLKGIRAEMLSLERRLAASKKKESTVLFTLSSLDLDIDLAHSLIQDSQNRADAAKQLIRKTEKNLQNTEAELTRLKDVLAKRLVYIYKYGRQKDIELLLTARSLNEGLLWLKYQKRLSESDFRNYVKIQEKQNEIVGDKKRLATELTDLQKLLAGKVSEERQLKTKKTQRQKILRSVRSDVELLRQQIAQKERAAEEMKRLIARSESMPSRRKILRPDIPISELRGRMIWPSQGKIVSRFGKQMHPKLKTVTENIGVDIQTPPGTPVLAVAGGRVTTITWQRGLGNIVIIKHYGGYHTAYAQLETILVSEKDDVEMGQKIGRVGETGSIDGATLHFQIWKNGQKLNPEHWLGKNI